MPRPRTPAVSSKMYRHFAAATLAITALLAVMVDWQGNQSAAQAMVRPAPANVASAKVSNFRDARSSRSRGGGGSDSGGYDGGGGIAPETDDPGGDDYEAPALAAVTASPRAPAVSASAPPLAPPPGMSAETFERIRRDRIGKVAALARPDDDRLRALINASLQRSGSSAAGIE